MKLEERRTMVKTFVFSITDHVLLLQPITIKVERKSRDPDERFLHLFLGTNFIPSARRSRRSIERILCLQARREKYNIKTIAIFKSRDGQMNASPTDRKIWKIMERFSTIAPGPTVRKTDPPSNSQQLVAWKNIR